MKTHANQKTKTKNLPRDQQFLAVTDQKWGTFLLTSLTLYIGVTLLCAIPD